MKAIRMHEFGGPEVLKLEDVERPIPAQDEVLVKVFASGINPIDWKIRKGARKDRFPVKLPLIPGWDLSGEVELVGGNVDYFKKGDKVYGRPDPLRDGTYAEYITVKAEQLYFKPETIGHIEAASVPLAGLTAWQALFSHGQLQNGQRVLIHAGSGGVGSWAVQFAHWAGAYVIATASQKNTDFVKNLGANEVVDYKKQNLQDAVTEVDLVLDTIGGDTQKQSIGILKPGGRLITTLAAQYEQEAHDRGVLLQSFIAASLPSDLKSIGELIDAQQVRPIVTKILALEEAAEAQRISEEGHVTGKMVLSIAADVKKHEPRTDS